MTKFVDIEIGADIGQIRLYTTDEDYETYGSDILNLINNLLKENEQLKQLINIADDLILCNTDSYRIPTWKKFKKEYDIE